MGSFKIGFIGEFEHVLDDKSRVIVPVKWREALGEKIYLCRSLDGTRCVWGFSEDEFARFCDKLRRGVRMGDLAGQDQLRTLSSSVTEAEVDKQGRILISPKLRDHAMIPESPKGTNVLMVGMMDRFEIWMPDRIRERQDGVETQTLLKKIDDVNDDTSSTVG